MRVVFLAAILGLAITRPADAQPLSKSAPVSAGLTDTSRSLHAKVRSVGLADVQWTDGFWADRLTICRSSMIPEMGRIMEGTQPSHFLHNFRIAAGLEIGKHRGPAWNDGDFFKWLEALAALFAVTKDAALERRMDAAIAVIAKAQRGDGYLHTPVLIKNRNGVLDAKPFQDRLNFEMYNFGHLFTAACVHHRSTGKKSLLDVAVKAADFLGVTFEKPTPELARNAVCPSHYMGIIELYRTTKDPRHLKLAKTLVAMRDYAPAGTDDNQDRLPFSKQQEAVGHAVRANYLYAGVADLYLETGDQALLDPLKRIWKNVVTKKMYVTGACGALYDGASPDGARDQKQIARVHQAYGRDYQLPNSTAHNETCAAVGNALWNWRMLQITGDAKHADVLELVLYNALLAGVSLDGKRYFYTNTLRQLDAMPPDLRWSRTRQEWISSYCCPPNVVRTVAEAGCYAYGRSERGIWVHLFGSNRLDTALPDGGRVRLQQETEYPWDGRVKFTMHSAPSDAFSLFVRIPGWVKGASVHVNDEPEMKFNSGSYAEIRRRWKSNDTVELNLPMPCVLLQANPLVEEARNQVALKRGPLVYCLEAHELPKGTSVQTVYLPRSASFQPKVDRSVLQGLTILQGKAELLEEAPWTSDLYRELKPPTSRSINLKLIPYYAWNNRGLAEMTVWLPLAR
jgi:DUF1680 family protein